MVGVKPAGSGALGHLLPGSGKRLAHLGCHHHGDLFLFVVQDPGRLAHPPGAVVERGQPIPCVCRRGRSQATLDIAF
jgi:hypothetical protein